MGGLLAVDGGGGGAGQACPHSEVTPGAVMTLTINHWNGGVVVVRSGT